jgi:hypothetical protein
MRNEEEVLRKLQERLQKQVQQQPQERPRRQGTQQPQERPQRHGTQQVDLLRDPVDRIWRAINHLHHHIARLDKKWEEFITR